MSIAPGRRLGPYEIVQPIGAGGIGEANQAKDTRLDIRFLANWFEELKRLAPAESP